MNEYDLKYELTGKLNQDCVEVNNKETKNISYTEVADKFRSKYIQTKCRSGRRQGSLYELRMSQLPFRVGKYSFSATH
jgi:hypothetical protein